MLGVKQQCHISMIYCTWAAYLGGLVFLGYRGMWGFLGAWLLCAPLLQWLYIRKFPSLSPMMGYGPIADEAVQPSAPAPVKVTLYTALGCPFCPLVEQRLEDLRKQIGFSLEKIDVTVRPDLLAAKGIRSVPVVEARGKLLVGLVTTKELAAAIGERSATPAAV